MSSMNATHSASTPARAYAARSASICLAPAWCVTRGRASGARSASACGTRSFSAAAPRLPPTTRTSSAPDRLSKRCSGGGSSRMSARNGLPTQVTPRLPANVCGKPVSTRSAPWRRMRFARPRPCVEVVDDQRHALRHRHQRSRKRSEAAEAEHDVRTLPAYDATRLDARRKDRERPEQQTQPALAADAGEVERLEFELVLGDDARFHPVARAEPEHAPSERDQLGGDRQPRKDVAAGAAGGDHRGAAHTVKPRSSRLFS